MRLISVAVMFIFHISVTIHIPLPKSHATSEPSDAPTAIASETPEGTYLIPVTQQSKPDAPPAVNLVLNLRLLLDGGISTVVYKIFR